MGIDYLLYRVPGIVTGMDQYRLIQEAGDCLVLQLVSRRGFEAAMLAELRRRILEFVGEDVTVKIEVLDALDEGRLKFRAFVSRLAGRIGLDGAEARISAEGTLQTRGSDAAESR
jgi:hypothetical protein